MEGNYNNAENNVITEAPIGILKLFGTVGNTHSGNSFNGGRSVHPPVP